MQRSKPTRRTGTHVVLTLCGLALVVAGVGASLAVMIAFGRPADPIYTVSQVAAGLARHPSAWVGRTITVRGRIASLSYTDPPDVNGGGVGSISCLGVPCHMLVPAGVTLHLNLVERMPTTPAEYDRLLPPSMAAHQPPADLAAMLHAPAIVHLVLLLPANHARMSQSVQHAVHLLPDSVVRALSHLALLVGRGDQGTSASVIQGGTTRLYRVRVLSPVPSSRRPSCTPVCDDGILLAAPTH